MKVRGAARPARFLVGTVCSWAVVAGVAGCAAGEGPGSSLEVTDSSGVTIVTTDRSAVSGTDPWRVEGDPLVRIGAGPGEEPSGGPAAPPGDPGGSASGDAFRFNRVADVVRDGEVLVVADAGSGEIRWFGTDGTHRATGGGRGMGPGEFVDLFWIGVGVDGAVHAWDRRLRRLSTFREGELVTGVRPALGDDTPFPVVRGMLGAGTVVAAPGAVYVPEDRPGVQRPPMQVWLFPVEGGPVDTLGPFPGRAVHLRPTAGDGWIRTEVPFGPATFVAARGEELLVAESGAYELRYFGAAGELARIVRVAHEPGVVTEADVEAELERRLQRVPPVAGIRAGVRASFENTPPAATMPAFEQVLIDRTGHVWLRRPSTGPTPDAEPRWDVVGPGGAVVATASTPVGLRVTDIGPDWLLGVWTDELGVEHVQMQRLVRP